MLATDLSKVRNISFLKNPSKSNWRLKIETSNLNQTSHLMLLSLIYNNNDIIPTLKKYNVNNHCFMVQLQFIITFQDKNL